MAGRPRRVFADDDIASAAEPLWELPPDYDVDDTLIIVVPAREPAILNIETLTSSSADGGCDTEDSAGAEDRRCLGTGHRDTQGRVARNRSIPADESTNFGPDPPTAASFGRN